MTNIHNLMKNPINLNINYLALISLKNQTDTIRFKIIRYHSKI